MKKIVVALLAVLFGITLASCEKENGNNGDSGVKKGVPGSVEPTFWDADGSGIDDWQEEEITLTYATWQYNNTAVGSETIDTLMIKAFEQKYPNVHVEMQIVGEDYEWDANMSALIETGDLPDVFLVYRLETALAYQFLADITDMYANDPDSSKIIDSMKSAGTFLNKRYAVPSFFYPEWWFVNKDILTEKGIEAPDYDWTWEQMEAIAAACYDESKHYAGQYDVKQYYRCLPKALEGNDSWGSFTFDGTKFNFDSKSFQDSIDMMVNAVKTDAATVPYSKEELAAYFGDKNFYPQYNGYAAIWSSPSWEAKGFFEKMNFEWDVYPAPGGTIGGNIDIIGVSRTCEYQQAAYQLLKWMSYSREGLETRYALYDQYKDILFKSANNYPYPIVDYGYDKNGKHIVWDDIPYDEVPGMKSDEMISAIRNAASWGNKEICGWDAMNKAIYNSLYEVYTQTSTFEGVFKDTFIELANETFSEFRVKLAQILSGEIDPSDLFPQEEPTEDNPEEGGDIIDPNPEE